MSVLQNKNTTICLKSMLKTSPVNHLGYTPSECNLILYNLIYQDRAESLTCSITPLQGPRNDNAEGCSKFSFAYPLLTKSVPDSLPRLSLCSAA